MNYNNATTMDAVPVPEKKAPLNEMVIVTKDGAFDVLILLNKLHNFLFAEERPIEAPETNIRCMQDCVNVLHDAVEACNRVATDICMRLGM